MELFNVPTKSIVRTMELDAGSDSPKTKVTVVALRLTWICHDDVTVDVAHA
jgi:hypothetical protein